MLVLRAQHLKSSPFAFLHAWSNFFLCFVKSPQHVFSMQSLVVLQESVPTGHGTFRSHGLLGGKLQSKSEVQTEKKIEIKGNLMYRNSLRCEDGPELRFATDF